MSNRDYTAYITLPAAELARLEAAGEPWTDQDDRDLIRAIEAALTKLVRDGYRMRAQVDAELTQCRDCGGLGHEWCRGAEAHDPPVNLADYCELDPPRTDEEILDQRGDDHNCPGPQCCDPGDTQGPTGRPGGA